MTTQERATRFPKELAGHLPEVASGYQQMLAENPRNPEALVGMCLVALASRQFEAAVKMAAAAVEVAPELGTAWVALGQALKAVERAAEAEAAYDQAIRLDGMNALARLGLGELKNATGHPEAAIQEFELALRRDPLLVAAHMGIGNALACMEHNEEALKQYEQVLSLKPRLPEAEFAVGFVLNRMGRTKEAETRYRRALVERPDFAAAWMNLGSLQREQGREVYAEAALRRAVELRPDLVSGWINLSILEREQKRMEEAEAHLRTAFALNPEQIETMITWCQFCAAQGDNAGAQEWLRWALAREPRLPEGLNMQGILLHNEGRFEEAIEAFLRAEAVGHRAAASNRGNSLLDLGRMAEALRAHELAVEREPNGAGAAYNLALTQLRLGDWKHGWPGYEARWSFREVHRNPQVFTQPHWQGEPLEGKRILLHAEQGLGDTIQFCRYATLVAARGGTILLQVQEPAARLLETLAVVRGGEARIVPATAKPTEFDVECSLMSLPAVFHTTVETVPWPGPYLGTEARAAKEKRNRTPYVRPGGLSLRVGLAWAGNPHYKADSRRSVKLETLKPLLRATGINWISLQKGAPAVQLSELPGDLFIWDCGSQDRDLADTATTIATLDVVVTTDTCIAHLAGAMGKPVWVMLPHLGDWRWMQETESSPWYPTMRLFRQRTPGDWMGVQQRVIKALRDLRQQRLIWSSRASDGAGESGAERSRLISA